MDCPFCGETVPDDTPVCPECGFPFRDASPSLQPPSPPERPHTAPSSSAEPARSAEPKIPVFIILLTVAGLLLLGGCITAFVLFPPDTASVEPGSAYLTIHSVPEGATVSIGGVERGQTPLTAALKPGAKYAVFIELDGYKTVYESVTLKEHERRTLSVKLELQEELPVSAEQALPGIWTSLDTVTNDKGGEYTVYYVFREDSTGKEYWFAGRNYVASHSVTWYAESAGEVTLLYDGTEAEEHITLTHDGSYFTDIHGFTFGRAEDLPAVRLYADDDTPAPADAYNLQFFWHANGCLFEYAVSLEKEKYAAFADEPRELGNFRKYLNEPYNRALVKKMAADFAEGMPAEFTPDERLSVIISFVQSIPYVSDYESTGFDEYYRYPVETLVDGIADCEDTSFLLAGLLKETGYDVVLIRFRDHMGLGIALDGDIEGAYWEDEEKKYYYLETTAQGLLPGDMPVELYDQEARVIYVE